MHRDFEWIFIRGRGGGGGGVAVGGLAEEFLSWFGFGRVWGWSGVGRNCMQERQCCSGCFPVAETICKKTKPSIIIRGLSRKERS